MSTDGFVIIAPDNTGKRIDNGVVTRSGVEYLRQRVEVPDGVAVNAALPTGTNTIGKVELTDGAGVVNTKQLGTAVTSSDVGLVTNSVIHGLTTGGGGGYVDVKVTPSGALTVDATLSASTASIGVVGARPYSEAADTGGRFRVSQLTTLFDGKIMNAEDTLKWDIQGTGSNAYANNAVTLSVTSGQYEIRQGRTFCPYYSGKPQFVEFTSFGFQNQTNVVKRMGYFSSNAVAPYDSNKDGFWIEADGTTYRLIVSRNGTETHNVPWTSWDNYSAVSGYDFSKFTVFAVDFLWLGGAGLRLFIVINGQFTLLHTIKTHTGVADGLIMLSPNQPVRYEIRSSTGTGSFTSVCSQVSSEGAGTNEQGHGVAIYTPSRACNVIGTIYALCGMRKVAAYRNHHVPITAFGATNIQGASTPEAGMLLLLRNPTLSAALTWTANSRIETAIATTQTISNVGRILKAIPMVNSSTSGPAPAAALRNLGVGIDNTMTELIVAYTPLTTNQNMSGYLQAFEY